MKPSAKWIQPGACRHEPNVYFRARTSFKGSAVTPDDLLCIAAESSYVLYVNGRLIGTGPARGSLTRNYYDSHDVAGYVRDGDNVLAVEVRCDNVPSYRAAPSEPALRVQYGGVVSNETWDVQLAGDWRRDVPKLAYQIGFMEWRDMRAEPVGWQCLEDASDWEAAQVVSSSSAIQSKALLPRDIPPLVERAVPIHAVPVTGQTPALADRDAVSIARTMTRETHGACASRVSVGDELVLLPSPDHSGISAIVDFGCIVNGRFHVDIEGPAGTIMDIGYAECMRDGRLVVELGEYAFADRFMLRAGRQEVCNRLSDRGFRYLQLAVRDFDQPVRIHGVSALDRRYPIKRRSTFECSDPQLNTLWERCQETLSACATDLFVDCPWRENSFWVNDLLVENLYWLQAFGDGTLPKRSLRLALSQRRKDGLIPGVCPSDGQDRFVLFATNLFLPLILRDYWMYTGDGELVDELLPVVADIVDSAGTHCDSDGLLCPPERYWNFVDWSYHVIGTDLQGKNACIVNAFHIHALDALAQLLAHSDETRSKRYAAKARHVAGAVQLRFWMRDANCLAEYLLSPSSPVWAGRLTHALWLLTGHVPDSTKHSVVSALAREDLPLPELYMMVFVLKAFAERGEIDRALDIIKRYWFPIIDSGSPTIWEMNVHQQGKEAFDQAGSLCHGFSNAPITVLQQHVLGVTPTSPGFETIDIAPQLGHLAFARGTVVTPLGDIEVEHRRQADGTVTSHVNVPDGIRRPD